MASLIPFFFSLSIYLATLRPEFDWGDSAELTLQAYQLGVTHPPGYPVHTFLGRLFILLFGDPMVATNLLSAFCTSLAAGLLSLAAHKLTHDWPASILAGLTFALVPHVWNAAVVTEVYGVNICFFALALLLLLTWHANPSRGLLAMAALVFGVSLGSYLANVLTLPAFIYLIWRQRRERLTQTALFLSIVALTGGLVLSWSYFRSRAIPPLGTLHVPDTPRGFLRFLTAGQYGPVRLHTTTFYVQRIIAHTGVFGRSFLWVGLLLGLAGLRLFWGKRRPLLAALLIAFVAELAYFTTYAATDYYTMVAPAYFIFALWIGGGIHALSRRAICLPNWLLSTGRLLLVGGGAAAITTTLASDLFAIGKPGFGRAQTLLLVGGCGLLLAGFALQVGRASQWIAGNAGRTLVWLASIALLVGLVGLQIPAHLEQRRRLPVTTFVLSSFEVLPQGAVVVASWDKLAALLYSQVVYGRRPDLTVVEPISNWHRYLFEQRFARPVVVDTVDGSVGDAYRFEPVPHGWYQVMPSP